MACGFKQCCRICAQENKTLVSIFGEEGLIRQLLSKLYYCLQITVSEHDYLPTTICRKCLSKLEICFELMQESIEGQSAFRKHSGVLNTTVPLTLETEEMRMEDKVPDQHSFEEQTSDLSHHSSAPEEKECCCEQCTAAHGSVQVKTEKHSELSTSEEDTRTPIIPDASQSSTLTSYQHTTPCQCEKCLSQYGSLPLLAHVVDNSDISGPSNVHKQTSPTTQMVTSQGAGRPVHRSRRIISCEFCGKTFSHTGDLNKHRRRHTGERPYSCSQCSRRFTHASNLLRHEKIHSGEMPHQCPVCRKKFNRKDKMVSHLKNTHKNYIETQSAK